MEVVVFVDSEDEQMLLKRMEYSSQPVSSPRYSSAQLRAALIGKPTISAEKKPSPNQEVVKSNRFSFFSAPTEPVRIDAFSFLGIRSVKQPEPEPEPEPEPVPEDVKADETDSSLSSSQGDGDETITEGSDSEDDQVGIVQTATHPIPTIEIEEVDIGGTTEYTTDEDLDNQPADQSIYDNVPYKTIEEEELEDVQEQKPVDMEMEIELMQREVEKMRKGLGQHRDVVEKQDTELNVDETGPCLGEESDVKLKKGQQKEAVIPEREALRAKMMAVEEDFEEFLSEYDVPISKHKVDVRQEMHRAPMAKLEKMSPPSESEREVSEAPPTVRPILTHAEILDGSDFREPVTSPSRDLLNLVSPSSSSSSSSPSQPSQKSVGVPPPALECLPSKAALYYPLKHVPASERQSKAQSTPANPLAAEIADIAQRKFMPPSMQKPITKKAAPTVASTTPQVQHVVPSSVKSTTIPSSTSQVQHVAPPSAKLPSAMYSPEASSSDLMNKEGDEESSVTSPVSRSAPAACPVTPKLRMPKISATTASFESEEPKRMSWTQDETRNSPVTMTPYVKHEPLRMTPFSRSSPVSVPKLVTSPINFPEAHQASPTIFPIFSSPQFSLFDTWPAIVKAPLGSESPPVVSPIARSEEKPGESETKPAVTDTIPTGTEIKLKETETELVESETEDMTEVESKLSERILSEAEEFISTPPEERSTSPEMEIVMKERSPSPQICVPSMDMSPSPETIMPTKQKSPSPESFFSPSKKSLLPKIAMQVQEKSPSPERSVLPKEKSPSPEMFVSPKEKSPSPAKSMSMSSEENSSSPARSMSMSPMEKVMEPDRWSLFEKDPSPEKIIRPKSPSPLGKMPLLDLPLFTMPQDDYVSHNQPHLLASTPVGDYAPVLSPDRDMSMADTPLYKPETSVASSEWSTPSTTGSTPVLSAAKQEAAIKRIDELLERMRAPPPDQLDTQGTSMEGPEALMEEQDVMVEDVSKMEEEPEIQPEPQMESVIEPELVPMAEAEMVNSEITQIVESQVEPEMTQIAESQVEPEMTQIVESKVEPEVTEMVESKVESEMTEMMESKVEPEVTQMEESVQQQVEQLMVTEKEEMTREDLEVEEETQEPMEVALEKEIEVESGEADISQLVEVTIPADKVDAERSFTVDERFVTTGRGRKKKHGIPPAIDTTAAEDEHGALSDSSFTISTPSGSIKSLSSLSDIESTSLGVSLLEDSVSIDQLAASHPDDTVSIDNILETNADEEDDLLGLMPRTSGLEKTLTDQTNPNSNSAPYKSTDRTLEPSENSQYEVSFKDALSTNTTTEDSQYYTPNMSVVDSIDVSASMDSSKDISLSLDSSKDAMKKTYDTHSNTSSDQKSLSSLSDTSPMYSPNKLNIHDAKRKFFFDTAQPFRIDHKKMFKDLRSPEGKKENSAREADDSPKQKPPAGKENKVPGINESENGNRKEMKQWQSVDQSGKRTIAGVGGLDLKRDWQSLDSGVLHSPTAGIPHSDSVNGETDTFYTPATKPAQPQASDKKPAEAARKRILPKTPGMPTNIDPSKKVLTSEEIQMLREVEREKAEASQLLSHRDIQNSRKSREQQRTGGSDTSSRSGGSHRTSDGSTLGSADSVPKAGKSDSQSDKSESSPSAARKDAKNKENIQLSPSRTRKNKDKKGKFKSPITKSISVEKEKDKDKTDSGEKKVKRRSLLALFMPSKSGDKKDKDKTPKSPKPKDKVKEKKTTTEKKIISKLRPKAKTPKSEKVKTKQTESSEIKRVSGHDEFSPFFEDMYGGGDHPVKDQLKEKIDEVAPNIPKTQTKLAPKATG